MQLSHYRVLPNGLIDCLRTYLYSVPHSYRIASKILDRQIDPFNICYKNHFLYRSISSLILHRIRSHVHGSCKCLSATRARVFLQLVQVFFCNSCKRFSATRAGIFRKSCRQTSGSPAGRLPEVQQTEDLYT